VQLLKPVRTNLIPSHRKRTGYLAMWIV